MDKIQSHEIKDIWRIREGLLVEIHKYRTLKLYDHSKKIEKRVQGCKGFTVLKESYINKGYTNQLFPKGTYWLCGSPVELIRDKKDYTYEIKSSGGSVRGSFKEIVRVLEDIQNILDSYK